MTKIYDTKARSKMILAMHKITKIGCDELIKEAIDKCQVPTIKQYIKWNYTKKYKSMGPLGPPIFPLAFANNLNKCY